MIDRNKSKGALSILALSFTNRCNLRCTHCGYDFKKRNKASELPFSFFLSVLAEAKGLGAEMINITGGEIFLRPDCMELVDGAVNLGYFVSLESNGTLLTDRDINQLSSYGSQVRLAISMDGFTTKVHDNIRGQGNYAKTMDVIRKISKKGMNARVNTVLHTTNLNEIPDMTKFFVDELGLGFRLIPFIMENGLGVYACKSTGVPYKETMKLLDDFFFPFLRERKEKKLLSIELRTALVPIDIVNHYVCQWGTSLLGIGPTGIASLCHVCNDNPNFIFGDIKTQSLTEIWENNELLDSFRNFNPNQLQGVCGNCLARDFCRGGCRFHAMIKYGNLYAPEPQCQTVYELGQFPEYALENPDIDNRYIPT